MCHSGSDKPYAFTQQSRKKLITQCVHFFGSEVMESELNAVGIAPSPTLCELTVQLRLRHSLCLNMKFDYILPRENQFVKIFYDVILYKDYFSIFNIFMDSSCILYLSIFPAALSGNSFTKIKYLGIL